MVMSSRSNGSSGSEVRGGCEGAGGAGAGLVMSEMICSAARCAPVCQTMSGRSAKPSTRLMKKVIACVSCSSEPEWRAWREGQGEGEGDEMRSARMRVRA